LAKAAIAESDGQIAPDLWLGVLGGKWGVELPSIREWEEVSAVLLEKIDRWEAEILERGIEQLPAARRVDA